MKCEGHTTSRGEQLRQWDWQEAAICISYTRYDHFLTIWKTFNLHLSYAKAPLLAGPRCVFSTPRGLGDYGPPAAMRPREHMDVLKQDSTRLQIRIIVEYAPCRPASAL
ncbi:hypothetical protein QO002_005179 [Pararhizobium capsulatum DSM 1112]|uniref:Uncharacterized protein n=1 Tax=Pararhizobium capsulatum DSM 1112 TaxID=1121113 RepID=A0ABU0BYD4_9HYPH|nr:hypothetical protein [Pararhizobium capsulatum DSM 1112]